MSDSDTEENGDPPIDPKVDEFTSEALSDEHLLGAYGAEGNGDEDKLEMVRGWFPGADEWQGKTVINPRQAKMLAVAKHLPEAFPEIEEYDDFITNIIDDYEMLLTSVGGNARTQHMNVLMSLFGDVSGAEEEEARNALMTALAGHMEGNDE